MKWMDDKAHNFLEAQKFIIKLIAYYLEIIITTTILLFNTIFFFSSDNYTCLL